MKNKVYEDLIKKTIKTYEHKGMNKDVKQAQRIILETKNPKLCYLFYCNILEADTKAFSKIIYESKNPTLIEYFEIIALSRQKDLVEIK